MIKLLIDDREIKFEVTKFPDGTSQVWKLQDNINFQHYVPTSKPDVYRCVYPTILWLFENEGELMQVLQLAQLVEKHLGARCILRVPFLPYGRQDKEINNGLSFALQTFKNAISGAGIVNIETFDPHSKSSSSFSDPVREILTPRVYDFHNSILNQGKHDIICFPDKGAATRYDNYGHLVIYCDKVRDQATGAILGLKVVGEADLTGKSILIIDDICDGGMTFIKVAEALKPYNPKQIDLAVSHGLFSKGRQCLHDAGITNIYTTNSLLRNTEGFKVW